MLSRELEVHRAALQAVIDHRVLGMHELVRELCDDEHGPSEHDEHGPPERDGQGA